MTTEQRLALEIVEAQRNAMRLMDAAHDLNMLEAYELIRLAGIQLGHALLVVVRERMARQRAATTQVMEG